MDRYFLRGIAKHHLKQFEGAILDFTKTLELESSNGDAYYWRSLSKAELKNNKGAIEDCDSAIKLKPQDAKYYLQRGKLRVLSKKHIDACNDFSIYKALGGDLTQIPENNSCKIR